jgi:23S rRNA (cytosine1962-C5)-methyltransferase
VDAGRDVQVIERLSQAGDHPILLSFPESEYLKGLICRVL